ncbi:ESPR-type extended signal peptide-containing protein [Mitsuokella multacida]|uniref:ESPR-type extended signal peptide-containing protein n=1 Tax=Mitsuokella multacida TaxID=52226 RepID=UPI001F43144B|nr:ESPR-type extended signal peptide-containing protein [Mitsuokella multacida]MCF2585624.1 YadA-like family protein [Mitsuokella multacida]
MNRIYKVIYSKARQCYIVVSELAKSNHKSGQQGTDHTNTPALARIIAMALTAGALTWGSTPGISWAADKDIVDKGAQPIAYDISPVNDGTNIAIGKNAKVYIGGGTQESMLSFGEKAERTYTQIDTPIGSFKFPTGWHIHSNEHAKKNLPEAIAIGTNSYARTGSIEIGAHTLAENKISIGDTTADQLRQYGVASTTLGTNSYTGGGFATTIGSYNVQTSPYEAKNSDDTLNNATKNAFSTVIGTFNSNESLSSDDSTSGVANMISGMANKVTNSNGAIVMGAGNSVKESSGYIDASPYSTHFDSAADMQKALMEGVASSAGGATLVIGGANSAEKTKNSQIMGVGNSMKSTTYKKVQYNYLDGFNSSITDASHVKVLGQNVTINKGADSNTVFGDYRTVAEGQTNNVIIGNADEKKPITTEKKETVILGHNANAKVDGGVALGADSVASVDKDVVGYDPSGNDHSGDTTGVWKAKAAAVSVGRAEEKDKDGNVTTPVITRQITNVAAGTKDTDAVSVAQLKASKTKYYSVNDSAPGAIFDNEEFEKNYTNKNNDGAKSYYAMAAGYGTYAAGDASTVIGSYSVIQNDKVKEGDDESLSPQGATAVSVGSFNFNLNTPLQSANDFSKWYSGTANSIVGQGNLTKDSNGVLIYGAGNKITNSYRGDVPINMLGTSRNPDVYQNPESFMDKVGEAVLQSGGQVMAIGGGNVADKTYMTQLMGVGNKVQGADITFTPPELQNDEDDYERYITAFNSAFNTQATRLNYVDGFYNNLTNAKNDYVIGMANDISGDDVSSNKSNIVIGDFHQMQNGSNNVILGSQDGNLTQKRYNTDGTLVTEESVNRFTHQENLEDAVMIGHNADVQKNGGIALGAGSVSSVDNASTDANAIGYDPATKKPSTLDSSTWKSTAAAVSVGRAEEKDKAGNVTPAITRQITNVAAGTQDTDAVNVAQLKAINTNIAASRTHFYSVNSTDETAKNYDNNGATGDSALAAGVGARAEANHGIAIGTDAWSNEGDGRVKGSGDIAIGYKATIQNYVNQSGSIALGQNSLIENTYGSTEKKFAFNQTTFTKYGEGFLPADANTQATGIAIGRNSFARTGSLMVGSHMYKGAIADMDEVDGTNSNTLLNRDFNNINMTTLGTNSFNSGTFATVTGSYSATTAKNKTQNFAATVNGSLNSIESYKDAADNSGVASSIVGTANRIANSNNTTILGAGNEVTNSLTDFKAPSEGGASAKALQDTLKDTLQKDAKGAVVISGIGNKVDSSHGVSVLGSKNVVNATDNIQLLGDNREVTGATGSVIIGSADSKTTTKVQNATILGHNANVEKEGGVALGAGSVASREAQVAGYDPSTKAALTETSATWKATNAAVSIGKEDGSMTRQITGVAAGTKATDAVNVAQLQKAIETAQASANDTDTHVKAGTYAVTTVKDATGKDTQGVALDVVDKAGTPVDKVTITDVAKASDIGDVSKLATGSNTVVDAINNVNTKVDTVDKKVGDLQYGAEGQTNVVTNGDSVTKAIGDLDKAIGNASTEAGKHTIVSTKDRNLTVENVAKKGEAANYQLALNKDITVDSVTAKTVTSDTVKTKNLSVSESASIGDVTINKGNQGTIDGLKNTAWDAKNITSGRAATEDQVKAATKNAVNYDDDTSKTITLREDTTIKNVANTAIEQGSKNAVNAGTVYNETRVKQDGKYVKASNTVGENLSVLDNQVASNSSNITNLNGRVNNLDSKVNKVGAGAAALAALHPLDFDPEDKWDFAVGYGNYRDANSVAVGAFYRPDDDTMFSVGTNFGNGENMINAGVSFKFGPKGKSQVRPGSTQEITELRATVARQDDQLKKQDSEIKELKAMVQQLMAKQDKQATTK